MNYLIVVAHPNQNWFVHRIAKTIQQTLQKNPDNSIEILDLYRSPLRQNFLELDENNRFVDEPSREAIQQKISRAHEIIFAFPVWWIDAPAILKNFFDQNITAGFAYKYIDGKLNKFLTEKKARLFITTWAPKFIYYMGIFLPLYLSWAFGRLWYCGIKLQWITAFNKMAPSPSEEQRQEWLSTVEKIYS